jgi:hypothetical protein
MRFNTRYGFDTQCLNGQLATHRGFECCFNGFDIGTIKPEGLAVASGESSWNRVDKSA